jgi:hypothetical protein
MMEGEQHYLVRWPEGSEEARVTMLFESESSARASLPEDELTGGDWTHPTPLSPQIDSSPPSTTTRTIGRWTSPVPSGLAAGCTSRSPGVSHGRRTRNSQTPSGSFAVSMNLVPRSGPAAFGRTGRCHPVSVQEPDGRMERTIAVGYCGPSFFPRPSGGESGRVSPVDRR